MNVIVRASVPAASLDAPIRSAIAAVDRDVPIIDARTQIRRQVINHAVFTESWLLDGAAR